MARRPSLILYALIDITCQLFTTGARADGYYAGIVGGQSNFETDISVSKSGTIDSKSSASYVFIGQEFANGTSVEGFYADLGKTKIIGKVGTTLKTGGKTYRFLKNATATASATTFGIAGKYYVDLHTSTRLSGKLGIHSWDRKTSLIGTTENVDISDDGVGAMAGLGIEFAASDKLTLMVGHDNFAVDDDNIAVSYLGLKVTFD